MKRCVLNVFGIIRVEAENEKDAKAKGIEEARKMGMVVSKEWGEKIEENKYMINIKGEWGIDVMDKADADHKLEQKVMELEEKYPNQAIMNFYYVCE